MKSGRKTETRRVAKPQPHPASGKLELAPYRGRMAAWDLDVVERFEKGPSEHVDLKPIAICPYGQPGDMLWVKEKFAIECPYGPPEGCDNQDHIIYWAKETQVVRDSITARWRSSLFMPRWASQLERRIEEIGLEPLQAINEEGALAEGVRWTRNGYTVGESLPRFGAGFDSPITPFIRLWDSISAKPKPVYHRDGGEKRYISHYESYPWQDAREARAYRGRPWHVIGNPLVWVVKFGEEKENNEWI